MTAVLEQPSPAAVESSDGMLVFDVGMNNGDDTAHYLSRGCRVVAVEANPALAAAAEERFADEVEGGRLKVLALGLGPEEGVLPFYVASNHEHSSFDRAMASRFGNTVERVEVPVRTLASVLAEFGLPDFIKVDIEGFDTEVLRSLADFLRDTGQPPPKYASAEGHSLDPLFLLKGMGYTRFKCVNQLRLNAGDRSAAPSNLKTAWGELSSAVPGKVAELSKKVRRRLGLAPAKRGWVDGEHPRGSSGPFGEETSGEWRTAEEVAYEWLHWKTGHEHRGPLRSPGWFDFHAKAG